MRPLLRAAAATYVPAADVVSDLNDAHQVGLFASPAFRANLVNYAVSHGIAAPAPIAPAPPYRSVGAGVQAHKAAMNTLLTVFHNAASTLPEKTDAVARMLGSVDALAAKASSAWCRAVERKRNRQYLRARGNLIANFGQYCAYCEMPAGAGLQVEHKLPKSTWQHLSVDWNNLLLSCPICNSVKGDRIGYAEFDPGEKDLNFADAATIRTAALGACMFPDDAQYTRFPDRYDFRFWQRVFDMSGTLLATRQLDADEFWNAASRGQLQLVDGPNDYVTVAWTRAVASEVLNANTIHDYIEGLMDDAAVTIDATNVGTLPQDLLTLLQRIDVDDPTLAAARPVPGTDQLTFTRAGGLDVVKTARFVFDTSSTPTRFSRANAAFAPVGGALLTERRNGPNAEWQRAYTGLIMPPAHARAAAINVFEISGMAVAVPDRRTYQISVSWNYHIAELPIAGTGGYRYDITRLEKCVLDIELLGRTSPAARMVTTPALAIFTARANLKPEQSDRRVPRRTRAFFAAMSAWSDLRDAYAMSIRNNALYGQLFIDASNIVLDTVRASGHWTVWLTVFDRFFQNHPARAALRASLFAAAVIPGTEPQT